MSQPPMPPSSPPPLPIGYALAPNGQTVQLKKVATQQRALILCILARYTLDGPHRRLHLFVTAVLTQQMCYCLQILDRRQI
jgi:hypothetical protein